jgi:hypothetical protein
LLRIEYVWGVGIIGLFLVVILVIGVLTAILYFLYKWLVKKGQKKIGILILITILGFLTFSIYTAFYPLDEFYEQQFEIHTGLDFPKTGRIVSKDSNYPDQHGDFWASAIVELDTEEYAALKIKLLNEQDFQIDTTGQGIGITTAYRELTKNINKEDIEVVYVKTGKLWFKVAFLKNKKTIIFERSSS